MKTEIAQYILNLRAAASMTHRAEDRPLYEKYLADAAVLLALAETEAPSTSIREAVRRHERLWGTSWLVDDAYKGPLAAWQKVKQWIV
jgi:hypothetical protein